jgi:hypothetical protein
VSALATLTALGVEVTLVPGGKLKLRGSGPDESKAKVLEYVRQHKKTIIAELNGNSTPGECEVCPAAGYWAHGGYAIQELLCFHYAYYLGKPGKPKPCREMRTMCPRR